MPTSATSRPCPPSRSRPETADRCVLARVRLVGEPGPAALEQPPHELDRAGDAECDREGEDEALPGCVLERFSAEVTEQGGVQGPDDRRDRVEDREAGPRVFERAGAEGDDRAP